MARRVNEGSPAPLGVTLDDKGANIAVFSAHATAIDLCLFDPTGSVEFERVRLPARTGDVFHGHVADIRPGQRYGLRAHGPYDPTEGHRFNANKLLVHPYALAPTTARRTSALGENWRERCPHARARGARRFQRALTQSDLLEPPGRRCGCWSTSPFRFSGLVRRFWFGATMELGRSMMMSAGAGAARPTGSSTTDRKICSTDSGGACSRSFSAAAAAALNDHQNLAALTGIAAPTRARERGARRFQRALTQSDLLEPPGRRCGCWSTSPFRFSGLVRRFWFGATMELGRLLSLVQRCGRCSTERSSEFGRVNRNRCPHARARARRAPIPASSDAERPARAAWAALRLLVDVAISF